MVVFHFLQKYGEELKQENNICNSPVEFPFSVCAYMFHSGWHTVLLSTQYCCLSWLLVNGEGEVRKKRKYPKKEKKTHHEENRTKKVETDHENIRTK